MRVRVPQGRPPDRVLIRFWPPIPRFSLNPPPLQKESAYDRAENELKRVITAEPDSCHAHFALEMLLVHLARFDEARPHFKQVLDVDPNDPDAHYQFAALVERDDPATAREHYEAALAVMPHSESACYRLQRLLRIAGEPESAKELLLRFQTLRATGPNRLYKNDGQGRFTDVTDSAGVAGRDYLSVGAAWADADHDGDLDLFVANFAAADSKGDQPSNSPNALWRNNGDGTFVDVAANANVECTEDRSAGVVFFDVDDDRDLDILVVNHHTKNRIFLNHRAGLYAEATSQIEALTDAGAGLGAVQGDVDANGLEDLLLLRGNETPRLLLQHERGRFYVDLPFQAIAEEIGGAVGGLIGDFDLDGDLDVVLLAAGNDSTTNHYCLWNHGNGRFAEPVIIGESSPSPDAQGAVAADLDGDGALEILVARAGKRPELWRAKDSPGRHWLEVVGLFGWAAAACSFWLGKVRAGRLRATRLARCGAPKRARNRGRSAVEHRESAAKTLVLSGPLLLGRRAVRVRDRHPGRRRDRFLYCAR